MEKDNDMAAVWRELFARWPASINRKGILISSYHEQIPFDDFVFNNDFIILQRPAPDAVGARRVCVPFRLIEAIKYTDPVKIETYASMGFVGAAKPRP